MSERFLNDTSTHDRTFCASDVSDRRSYVRVTTGKKMCEIKEKKIHEKKTQPF